MIIIINGARGIAVSNLSAMVVGTGSWTGVDTREGRGGNISPERRYQKSYNLKTYFHKRSQKCYEDLLRRSGRLAHFRKRNLLGSPEPPASEGFLPNRRGSRRRPPHDVCGRFSGGGSGVGKARSPFELRIDLEDVI
jgi:hypothetical protein